MDNLLNIQDLYKHYSDFELKDVNLAVPANSVIGFIGANGAGKTTTIKAALGLIPTDGGMVELFGQRTDTMDAGGEATAKQRIGVVFDACAYPGELCIADIMRIMAGSYTRWDSGAFTGMLRGFGLSETKKVKDLSRGMGMKLMLAVALSHGADLLVLDEATAGLDPMARDEVLDTLRDFMEVGGRGILMSSHITSDLEKIADYIICIDDGRIVFSCEKDAITETAGIARCRADQFGHVVSSGFFAEGRMRFMSHTYGTDVLVENRNAFAAKFSDIVLDRVTIDDYMALRLKGSLR